MAASSSSAAHGKRDRLPIEMALSIQGLGKGQELSMEKVRHPSCFTKAVRCYQALKMYRLADCVCLDPEP